MMTGSTLRALCFGLAMAGLAAPAIAFDDDKARNKALAKLEKRYEKELKRCREGDQRICLRARTTQADIEELKRSMAKKPGA